MEGLEVHYPSPCFVIGGDAFRDICSFSFPPDIPRAEPGCHICLSFSADMAAEKLDTQPVHKTYHSPWEQVILSDPSLAESLQLRMPEPEPRQELPEYKCFNRVATPYGGFEKAPRGITFKLPEVDLSPPQYQELSDPQAKRPTFNRTAQGWISEGIHLILPTITLESFSVPESDDL
uniref:Myozenin 2b n=1 Tax=Poecilia reticulata TaxID=8081 RepID=A0A3P9NC69_POERE